MNKKITLIKTAVVLCIFALGATSATLYHQKFKSDTNTIQQVPANKYLAFIDEVFSVIMDNYWNKVTEDQLVKMFVSASEHITGQIQLKEVKTKQEMLEALKDVFEKYETDEQKRELAATLSDVVLSNLEPAGRSRLYSQKQQQELAETVNNINPDEDRYQDLELDKNATEEQIKIAYETQSQKYDPETNKDSEAKEKYEQIQKAYEVLGDKDAKKLYDLAGIEPTMEYKTIGSSIFYVHITKFSPTTVEELQRVASKVTDDSYNTLILDLQNNIGGAIDGLPFFLGPFIGSDQYAYQFFHQGDKTDYKTKTGWLPELVKFKKVVVLTNNQSQSTAEVMAATLKKYNVGVLVGTPTKGWGTVEKVFPMNNQIADDEVFSIFLVHSLTLREDGTPIEGAGVEPHILTSSSGWERELFDRYGSQEIVNEVKKLLINNQ